MFKTRGAMFGVVVAVATAGLLVAGLSFAGTTGAATDINGAPADLTIPTDNPPASPIEPGTPVDGGSGPTTGNPVPGDPNSGDAGAGGLQPGQLPSAGYGTDGGANSAATLIVLLAVAGAAIAGAGASVVATNRRD